MQYKGVLTFSQESKRLHLGQNVSYKEYLVECKANDQVPWPEEGYPHHEFDKFNWEFLVTADSEQEAAEKVMAHKKVQKVFGKAKVERCNKNGWYDIRTKKTDLGWWRCLSLQPWNPTSNNELVVIE